MRLLPYFGSKTRLALGYDAPRHGLLVEPFAGGAAYALRYPDLEVELYDIDPIIVGVWDWIIRATTSDIAQIPDNPPDDVRTIDVSQELQWLLGFWANPGSAAPRNMVTEFGRARWHLLKPRLRIMCPAIGHWSITSGSYENIDTRRNATWFVDPPYQVAGKHYRYSSVDYANLGEWCRHLPGQTIVCEQLGADWLEFRPHKRAIGNTSMGNSGLKRSAVEVVWESDPTQLRIDL